MGGIAIIDLGKGIDRNPATIADYGGIYSALGGNGGKQNITNRFIVINGGGEAVGYSDQMGTQYTPETVAGHIKRGGVWIDYTGAPFYYQATPSGAVSTLGQTGWHQFTAFLGYGWLSNQVFIYPGEFSLKPQYPFRRGFPLSQSLDGVCYDNGSFPPPNPLVNGFSPLPLAADGFASVVALHPPGGGYYFYGSYRYSASQLLVSAVSGVPINLYANFITNVLRGNTSGYICRPYKIAVQPTHTVQPGPTSPVRIGSATHTTTAHTAKTTVHTAKTTRSGTPSVVEDVLLVGGVLTGAGLVAVSLLGHHHRTQ